MLKAKNSKGHDDVDMCLVKLVIPYILKPLKHIFNNSLQKGAFPDSMNIARVISTGVYSKLARHKNSQTTGQCQYYLSFEKY